MRPKRTAARPTGRKQAPIARVRVASRRTSFLRALTCSCIYGRYAAGRHLVTRAEAIAWRRTDLVRTASRDWSRSAVHPCVARAELQPHHRPDGTASSEWLPSSTGVLAAAAERPGTIAQWYRLVETRRLPPACGRLPTKPWTAFRAAVRFAANRRSPSSTSVGRGGRRALAPFSGRHTSRNLTPAAGSFVRKYFATMPSMSHLAAVAAVAAQPFLLVTCLVGCKFVPLLCRSNCDPLFFYRLVERACL